MLPKVEEPRIKLKERFPWKWQESPPLDWPTVKFQENNYSAKSGNSVYIRVWNRQVPRENPSKPSYLISTSRKTKGLNESFTARQHKCRCQRQFKPPLIQNLSMVPCNTNSIPVTNNHHQWTCIIKVKMLQSQNRTSVINSVWPKYYRQYTWQCPWKAEQIVQTQLSCTFHDAPQAVS